MKTFYQNMTSLPRHIEERLLEFNVLQLCALVSEKGTKWVGASDQYGPIQEIAKRWKLEELTTRIQEIQPEEPLKTYARIMTAIGGNPAAPAEIERREAKIREVWDKKTKPLEQDEVRTGLATCQSLADLKAVAKAQGLTDIDWEKVDGLANFGLKRMYVGNKWRTKIRRDSK